MQEDWMTSTARDSLWFSAKIRFELTRQNSADSELEDRIYIFQCSDQDSAERKALEIGRRKEHEYSTDQGDRHKWRLIKVLRVVMTFLDTPLDDGVEVYSERIP